jgi:hypothetical protein
MSSSTPPRHRRHEQLVLQIAVEEAGLVGEPEHLSAFGQRAGERLLAGDGTKRRAAGADEGVDLGHGLEPAVVRRADPDRVHLPGDKHPLERAERSARTEAERLRLGRERFAPLEARAVDGGDADVAHRE